MSLLISFEGRLTPYGTKEPEHHLSVQKTTRTKKIVYDLHHHFGNSGVDSPQLINHFVKQYQESSKNLDRQYYARDIMQTKVFSLSKEQSMADALQILKEHSFRHLPIIEDKKLIGIISDRHLLEKLADGIKPHTKISDIMVKTVITSLPQTNIVEIARAMLVEKINCLPVTDENLILKGIITTSDLLGVIIRKLPFTKLV